MNRKLHHIRFGIPDYTGLYICHYSNHRYTHADNCPCPWSTSKRRKCPSDNFDNSTDTVRHICRRSSVDSCQTHHRCNNLHRDFDICRHSNLPNSHRRRHRSQYCNHYDNLNYIRCHIWGQRNQNSNQNRRRRYLYYSLWSKWSMSCSSDSWTDTENRICQLDS